MIRGMRLLLLAGLLGVASVLAAQGFRNRCNGCAALEAPPNPPYDGRFTYARIKFTLGMTTGFGGRYMDVKWGHDYPDSDRHFPKIVEELTTAKVRTDGSVILSLDDPALFKYPFAYLCEVGFWVPNDAEVAGLRNYLLKGGFLLVDDFTGGHWYNFEAQMRKVLPEARLIHMTADHPIFDSFYRINAMEYFGAISPFGERAEFYGIFEDNDPAKRLMAIVNYNFDVSEYWEYSDTGLIPIDVTNEAYKLGVNYLMYSLTH